MVFRTDYLIEDVKALINSPNAIADLKNTLKNTLKRETAALDILIARDFHTGLLAKIDISAQGMEISTGLSNSHLRFVK